MRLQIGLDGGGLPLGLLWFQDRGEQTEQLSKQLRPGGGGGEVRGQESHSQNTTSQKKLKVITSKSQNGDIKIDYKSSDGGLHFVDC